MEIRLREAGWACGAVCRSGEISAGDKRRQSLENHSAFFILPSAFYWQRGRGRASCAGIICAQSLNPGCGLASILSTPHLLAGLRALAAAGDYSPFCIPLGCGAPPPA